MSNYIWRKFATAEWLENHEAALHESTAGLHSTIERPRHARITLELFCARRAEAEQLRQKFGGAVALLPNDWEQRMFQAHRTKPLRVGARLVVLDEGPAAADRLVIPAGCAFGTGEHATTAMSLRMLERSTRRRGTGWRMLDAGTGSGILALAGKRFGAGEVVALDHDSRALQTARENARTNEIRRVKFAVADLPGGIEGRFDIITANLFSELLRSLLPTFRQALNPGGLLILSGVLRAQKAPLIRALRPAGFVILETRRRGKWIAILAQATLRGRRAPQNLS